MQGALYTGFFVNPLDIASNFSGTILGITNAFGTIPGWLAPLIAGALTRESVSYFVLARTGLVIWQIVRKVVIFDVECQSQR